jgi:thymidylate synthase
MKTVRDIQQTFKNLLSQQIFSEDGNLEIINASFIADEETIFGDVVHGWCRRELQWYLSQSLKIEDIPAPIPAIWKQIASLDGEINSNYGWCVFSEDNHRQYLTAIKALEANATSRQAVMIYTRPTMHEDSRRNGMKDFMCTYSTQMLIRNNELHYIVNMRSSDVVFGYKGDWHWHNFVQDMALCNLERQYPELKKGPIYWNAGSLHVYPRHFNLV